jgi:TonB-dependent receptor
MTDRVPHLIAALVAGAIFLAVAPPAAAQQTGAIAGVVVDGGNGETLPGANVSIKETTVGTATDLNGRYKIKELEAGTYDVVFSFVGFQRKTITGVEVTAGATTTLDVTLQPESRQLDEVVVSAEVAKDSEAGLLKSRQKAAAVSDAISAELMNQSGASSAADAMKKVTGVSVTDGQYVQVRGLGGRYTSAQLNGLAIPTASDEKNAVQFDLFSSNLLDNITTNKTFTPDQPGNFAGGLINLNTESYPSDLRVKVSSSVSVNTETHFHDDFLSYPGGDYDWLGFDDGTREIPDFVEQFSPDELSSSLTTIAIQNYLQNGEVGEEGRRLDQASKAFNNVMGPTPRQAPINQSYSAGVGNEIDLFGNPLGFLLNVNYGYSSSYFEGFRGRYRNPIGETELDPETLLDFNKGTTTAKLGGLASANYTVSQNTEIGANFLYSRRGESEASTRFGRWPEQFGSDTTTFFQSRSLRYTERQIYSAQLRGQHLFPGLADTQVEWKTSYSDTQQDEPDVRLMGNRVNVSYEDGAPVDTTRNADPQGFNNPSRIFRDLSEDSYSAKLDVTVPFTGWGESESEVKVGASYKNDTRSFNEQQFLFDPPTVGAGFSGDESDYWSDENMGIVSPDEAFPEFGNTVFSTTDPADTYTGDRTVAAGYAMVDFFITNRFRVVTGARLERTDIQIESEAFTGVDDSEETPGQVETTDVLPSLNAIYSVREDMNLRLAASQTLARPTFRELAPFARTPFILGEIIIGNPGLDRTLIRNVDLRWEWFPAPGEIVAASVFAKDFSGAIEVELLESTNGQRSWDNTDAEVYGAELEVRTGLDRLSPALENFTAGTNLSLIHSEAQSPGSAGGTRPLEGQSPYTFNFDLTYDNPETGTTAGVYFNTFGERLTALGRGIRPNVFEQPFNQINVTFSQRFMEHWTVDASVDNLLGDTSLETHTLGGNDITYNRQPRGRSISVGLSYQL